MQHLQAVYCNLKLGCGTSLKPCFNFLFSLSEIEIKLMNYYCFRQLGPPTLFLTLSSSEFAWKDLMLSILKTKKDIHDIKEMISAMKTDTIGNQSKAEFLESSESYIKENMEDVLNDMSSAEMNRLVNENIVLTTIEFQNRIQNIMKKLKIKGFLDDKNTYRVEDSFLRIEHQVSKIHLKSAK